MQGSHTPGFVAKDGDFAAGTHLFQAAQNEGLRPLSFKGLRFARLITVDRYYDFSVARFDVAFQMKDLLPSAKHQISFSDRYGQ